MDTFASFFLTLNCKVFVSLKLILPLSSHIYLVFYFCFVFQKWLSQEVP